MAQASTVFIAVAIVALAVHAATAKNITVGAPSGSWDLTTNYATWAAAQTFDTGDNLIFSYSSQHDVLEVSKADYGSCSTSSPIMTYKTGNDVVALPTATTRYFICGTPGHCKGGMKLAVTVVASSTTPSPPASSPTPSSPGSPPSSTTSPPPPPPPGKSGAAGQSFGSKAAVGFGLGAVVLLAL